MISTDELMDWLGAEPEDRATVEGLRAAAIAYINEPGGRYFGPLATITEDVTWNGGTFQLGNEPVGGTVTFTQWGSGGTYEAYDASSWRVSGRLVYGVAGAYARGWPVHLRASYQAGYAPDSIDDSIWAAPEDIKQAVRMIVADWFLNREGTTEVSAEVNVAVQAILRKYR